jgi:hypothetical protein
MKLESTGLNEAATEVERKNGPYSFMYQKKNINVGLNI